jgi:hypothetical protein
MSTAQERLKTFYLQLKLSGIRISKSLFMLKGIIGNFISFDSPEILQPLIFNENFNKFLAMSTLDLSIVKAYVFT